MPARRIIVRGRVQGVFFRTHAQEKAQELGLMGWVHNKDDAVEIHAEGSNDALRIFEDWCKKGPKGAQVTSIESERGEPEGCASFEIRY